MSLKIIFKRRPLKNLKIYIFSKQYNRHVIVSDEQLCAQDVYLIFFFNNKVNTVVFHRCILNFFFFLNDLSFVRFTSNEFLCGNKVYLFLFHKQMFYGTINNYEARLRAPDADSHPPLLLLHRTYNAIKHFWITIQT